MPDILTTYFSPVKRSTVFISLSKANNRMVKIHVCERDLLKTSCDLIIVKHADGFLGVDEVIAQKVGFGANIVEGNHAFIRGLGTGARNILFIGVGPIGYFRYERIRQFGAAALRIASSSTGVLEKICTPIHGPGYGLDDREAFLSLVSGFYDALDAEQYPRDLNEIAIVERNPARAQRLKNALRDFEIMRQSTRASIGRTSKKVGFGALSEEKKKLFVAMPFSDRYTDVWDIAIQEACVAADIIAERIDSAVFAGDILSEIKSRLESCRGLIALLDDANPNVYLELGYAWALKKPTILLSSSAEKLPFDVRGQKCIIYPNLSTLRKNLAEELRGLSAEGLL